jgi:hypothetical protein
MLEVYRILVARHCTDGNVRFVWHDDDDDEGDHEEDGGSDE